MLKVPTHDQSPRLEPDMVPTWNLKLDLRAWKHSIFRISFNILGTQVAMSKTMIRWLIATYIVLVLVLSAKAGASKAEQKSNLVFKVFNYSSEAL